MYFRTLLIAALCIGLNSSLCTGGIFSVGAAVANQIAYSDHDTGQMSYGSIENLSCKSSKRAGNEMESVDIGGCKNATTCFTQAHSILEDRVIPIFVSFVESIPHELFVVSIDTDPPKSFAIARVGPLYEAAKSQTHTLLKLE